MKRTALFAAALGVTLLSAMAPSQAAQYTIPGGYVLTGQVLPNGYQVVQSRGANRYIAVKNGRLYFVQGNTASYLNPRYSIEDQIRQYDTRRHFLRD